MPRTRFAATWLSSCAAGPRKRAGLGKKTLHRASEPDRVEHRGRREVAVRQLPDETGLHHVEQGRMNAALCGVGVGEVALLHRQAAQIVSRHGTDLIQLADQEVGERLLRLGCGLMRAL